MVRMVMFPGLRHADTYVVTDSDLASVRYPEVCKPPVLASARLIEVVEDTLMRFMGGCYVGSFVSAGHASPALCGTVLELDAIVTYAQHGYAHWVVQVTTSQARQHVPHQRREVALVEVHFKEIALADYVSERLAPLLATTTPALSPPSTETR